MGLTTSAEILNAVRSATSSVRDPETGKPLLAVAASSVIANGSGWTLRVEVPRFDAPLVKSLKASLEESIARDAELRSVSLGVEIGFVVQERPVPKLGTAGVTIKSVIAVGSGKGGVGKSTVSVGIAMSLARSGARVGLLDADVYGPSLPTMTGVAGQPEVVGDKIEPLRTQGMPVMSMGLLVPASEAVIWRGPMLHQAVTRFVRDVAWGDLDYLIVDMPPGTGDVAISLTQLLPVSGAVVVCTPQDVALADAIKAVGMLRKVKVPILGIVENMSGFKCPGCSKVYDIFGKGGAREYAEQSELPFLGELPITMTIREKGDAGEMWNVFDDPTIAAGFDSLTTQLALVMAQRTAASPPKLSLPVLS